MATEAERIADFEKLMSPLINEGIKDLLIEKGFFTQAASTRFHGSYAGGLFDHSLAVAKNLKKLTGRLDLEWMRPQSPLIVGMFHDLCKIDQYTIKNGRYIFVRDTEIRGHGDKSVILLSRLIAITEEEEMCIRHHMGAFVDDNEAVREYTDAIKKYPNVLWTHTADMMASHIDGV